MPSENQQCLSAVMAEVIDALNAYQASASAGVLPPLSEVDFDFKTTIQATAGLSLDVFIFKFGASRQKETVSDLSFTYAVPRPSDRRTASKKPVSNFASDFAATIQTAVAAVQANEAAAGVPFARLELTLQYGVTWQIDGAGNYVYSLVTVGLNGAKNKNTIQTVKLTFGMPDAGDAP